MIYITADHHFYHKNIIQHSNRPFHSEPDMRQELIDRHNQVVSGDDTVYILGDAFFSCRPKDVLAVFTQLNGNIKYIFGNHEQPMQKAMKLVSPIWNRVEVLGHYHSFVHNGTFVVLCHYPIESWNRRHHGAVHFHGHSHGTSRQVDGRMDVGVDCNGYTPVSLDTAIGYLLANRKEEHA